MTKPNLLQELAFAFLTKLEEVDTAEGELNKTIRKVWGDDFAPEINFVHPHLERLMFDIVDEILEPESSKNDIGGPASYWFYEARKMKDGGSVTYPKEWGSKSFIIKTLDDLKCQIKYFNKRRK